VIDQSILRQRCGWSGDVASAEAGAVVEHPRRAVSGKCWSLKSAAVHGARGKPEWGRGMREAFLRSAQKGTVAHDKGVEERFSSARSDRAPAEPCRF
jgi:hypothetical protein